ncbi:class I SAM-dependent methyltransferase [Pelagibacteraceae bacterium]|nr:class I SAM-dependent methyltransferase [Pelagibacteraceae bacterium]
MNLVKKKKYCEVCFSKNLIEVLNLGKHPLCDDLIPLKKKKKNIEYPIVILFCKNCRTAYQKYSVNKKKLFPYNYHYRARMTGSVLSGMKDLVNSIEKKIGSLQGKNCLDIGCNDGSLLDFFKKKGCNTLGVEPTGAAKECEHRVINKYFDKEAAQEIKESKFSPDIITFTNVFAHIENLEKLINNLKIIISPNTILVIENHYLGSVLKYGQFDTFYHEHPRTYSVESFKYIAKTLKMNFFSHEFVSRYGGNIRAYLGNGILKKNIIKKEINYEKAFLKMNKHLVSWKKKTKEYIVNHVKKNGKFIAKAFPGRAAILIKLLNLNENHISAVYEIKNSIKVNHYVPGTRIPILPESKLYLRNDLSKLILNLAWHLPKEVRNNLIKNGYLGKVIDIKKFKNILNK